MFRALTNWILAFLGMVRELEKQRDLVTKLEQRVQNLEESLHLLIEEVRHIREMAAVERENLLLKVGRMVSKALPASRKKRRGKSR